MAEFTLKIDGMHCGSCVRRVSQALAAAPGVAVNEVRVGRREVSVCRGAAPRRSWRLRRSRRRVTPRIWKAKARDGFGSVSKRAKSSRRLTGSETCGCPHDRIADAAGAGDDVRRVPAPRGRGAAGDGGRGDRRAWT